jgi:hypothetical protein
MKRFFLLLAFIFTFSIAQAQPEKWAIGFKVGEPTGVVIRKYGDRNALDITVGTYSSLLKTKAYRGGEYSSIGFMLNGSYLWFVPMFNDRMIAYGGAGVQINARRYYPNSSIKQVHTNNISTGPSFTGGLEFFFAQKPTSFFIEGGGYVELLPKVLYFNPNVNIGLRHNF